MSERIDLAQAGIEVTTTAHLASPSLLGEYVADGQGIPHRADGTPGSLCAGWDARRKAWAAAPADRDLPSLAHAASGESS